MKFGGDPPKHFKMTFGIPVGLREILKDLKFGCDL